LLRPRVWLGSGTLCFSVESVPSPAVTPILDQSAGAITHSHVPYCGQSPWKATDQSVCRASRLIGRAAPTRLPPGRKSGTVVPGRWPYAPVMWTGEARVSGEVPQAHDSTLWGSVGRHGMLRVPLKAPGRARGARRPHLRQDQAGKVWLVGFRISNTYFTWIA
jgi:hypothetical protein